jgi:hypothetical protein
MMGMVDMTHGIRNRKPNKRGFVKNWTFICAALFAQASSSETIFEEGFDGQQDWTSTLHSTEKSQEIRSGDIIPDGWWGIYQDTSWSPETGYPTKHASLEILAANADKSRSGTGKSAVFWRESNSFGNNFTWASDAQFVKVLDNDYPELYVEFYVRFSENWWPRGKTLPEIVDDYRNFSSKMFRMGHWTRQDFMWNGQGGQIGQRFIWQYTIDDFGLRSSFYTESGPPPVRDGLGGPSNNYTTHIVGQEVGGTDPQLFDQDPNGSGELLSSLTRHLLHENVFGPASQWTKVAFYVKSNSAPGVADGLHYQWINDHRVMARTDVPWVAPNAGDNMPGWNFFAIGGNDFFRPIPDDEMFEDWYSIDDVIVGTSIPEKLLSAESAVPNPPSSVSIQ